MNKTCPTFKTSNDKNSLISNNPFKPGQIVKMILHTPDFTGECITKGNILTPTRFTVLLSPPLRVVSVQGTQINAALVMLGGESPVITHTGNATQFLPLCQKNDPLVRCQGYIPNSDRMII